MTVKQQLHTWLLPLLFFLSLAVVAGCSCGETKVSKVNYNKYNSLFNDMNGTQLKAAQRFGIVPVDDRSYAFDDDKRLVKVSSCDAYKVDDLDYSVPYLTKGASALLRTIGENFRKRLDQEGLSDCRLIVTSLLRTKDDVRRLQGVNANASSNSTHCYATTFDITYQRFDGGRKSSGERYIEILSDVLQDLRKQGRCYVRFETNQHCFHITSRK